MSRPSLTSVSVRISYRQPFSKIPKHPPYIRRSNALCNHELGLFDRPPFVLLPLLGIGTQPPTRGSVGYRPHVQVIAEKLIAANPPTRQDSLTAEILERGTAKGWQSVQEDAVKGTAGTMNHGFLANDRIKHGSNWF